MSEQIDKPETADLFMRQLADLCAKHGKYGVVIMHVDFTTRLSIVLKDHLYSFTKHFNSKK
jgi:hypothetical protein